MKKIAFTLLLIIFSLQIYSQPFLYAIKDRNQVFEFVKINLSNDSVTTLSQLPIGFYSSFFSSCFDPVSSKYYLCAGRFLFIIDAITGTIDSNNISIPFEEQFLNIVFNPRDGIIYGIIQNTIQLYQKLGKYNLITETMDTSFSIVPGVNAGIGCKAVFNAETQEYIIQSSHLSTIDILNGHIQYDYPIQNQPQELLEQIAFSCQGQNIYGLINNPYTEQEYFGIIDTSNGLVSHISPTILPVYYYKQYLGGSTIDNSTGTYYYPAIGGKIYGINLQSGNVIYSHDYGPGFEFLFLESESNYYCPIQSTNDEDQQSKFSCFPNPTSGCLFVSLTSNDIIKEIKIYDLVGNLLSNFNYDKVNKVQIDIFLLDNGIYLLEIVSNKNRFIKKIIKE